MYFLIYLFQDGEVEVSNEVLKIVLTRGADAIVIEGTEVLQISDAPRACACGANILTQPELPKRDVKNVGNKFMPLF